MDEQNSHTETVQGKEAYEAKKAEKQGIKNEERAKTRNSGFVKKMGTILLALLVIGIVGFGIVKFFESQTVKGEDFSQAIPIMEASHMQIGSSLPEYTSNPPSSGPHYGQTAKTGSRDKEIPDQHLIHNLEHGDIWIAYHPRISETMQNQLKKFGASKVVVTPREANETDVALVAWGRIDTFNIENNLLDKQRIRDFIKRNINRGPERVGPQAGGV